MNLDTQSLDTIIEGHFSKLRQRVQFRLSSTGAVDWLLKSENEQPFQPDYLTMSSAGRTRFEQSLNRLLNRLLPDLWFKLFWPKITKGLIAYTEDTYYKKIFSEVDDPALIRETQQYISASLRALLSRNWENLARCTFTELSNCLLAVIHEPLKQLPIEQDIFLPAKRTQNRACLELARKIRTTLHNSENKLENLIYLSCRSNWIDSLESDPETLLREFVRHIKASWTETGDIKNKPLNSAFYQLEHFKRVVTSTTGPVLFESDNCGEIVFDLWLIEELISQNRIVYLCVKESPVVNDAMEKDVRDILEDDLFSDLQTAYQRGKLRFISAGSFVGGGKLVHDINEEYRKAYLASDLVIIKGQGNFQSMPIAKPGFNKAVPYRYQNPVVYLTGIKANMIQMCLTALYPKQTRPAQNSMLLLVNENDG